MHLYSLIIHLLSSIVLMSYIIVRVGGILSARNGSHYGIPQGRSVYLSKVDGYKQIEWGIKYNLNRYGSMCKALDHFKIKGWH
jgi:hypothetical protein